MKKNPEQYKIRFTIGRAQHQNKYSQLLAKGMRVHGFSDIRIANHFNFNETPDLAAFWAHKKVEIIKHQKIYGNKYLVMERAYVGDRHNWVSLGYNGLNGRADFCNQHITSLDRWNLHFKDYLKPWKTTKGSYALVIGQVYGDASIAHVDINDWYRTTIAALNKKGIPVVFRQHPLDRVDHKKWHSHKLEYTLDKNLKLEQTLQDALCCVTFSSNSAVISAIEGTPVVAMDMGSMAREVASNNLDDLDYRPDRDAWLAKLAYCQWLPEELENGTAWDHLKQGLDK